VGALPIRGGKNSLQILLVTSRDTGRWVIPKGWPSKRMTDAAAAAREARQEAGVTGKTSGKICGHYRYRKLESDSMRVIEVDVFLLRVKKEKKRWREAGERYRAWFNKDEAVSKVREPGLKAIIRGL
jgi:8-oxo-dGTP pyrophosphatase MutT (NUDIX family)